MDYNKYTYRPLLVAVTAILLLMAAGCGGQEKQQKMNVNNTCYIEIDNTIDTIRKILGQNFFGKTSFYKKDKLEIRSLNYLGDEVYPDMVFYKPMSEIGKDTPQNTRKLKIELAGNYTVDSTYFSITQYHYKGKEWKKFSDQGWMKATLESSSRLGTDSIRFWQLSNQITNAALLMVHRK